MRQSIISLSLLLFIFAFGNGSFAQKLSKKAMEARITALEAQNESLKKEMEVMKSQIRMLLSSLPKPQKDPRPRGGMNPHNLGGTGQVAADVTTMEFEKTSHDFGEISAGASVSYTFKFKNTGNNPLKITSTIGKIITWNLLNPCT